MSPLRSCIPLREGDAILNYLAKLSSPCKHWHLMSTTHGPLCPHGVFSTYSQPVLPSEHPTGIACVVLRQLQVCYLERHGLSNIHLSDFPLLLGKTFRNINSILWDFLHIHSSRPHRRSVKPTVIRATNKHRTCTGISCMGRAVKANRAKSLQTVASCRQMTQPKEFKWVAWC